MNRIFKILFFGLVIFNLYLASFYVRNGDIVFNSDTARDFFLYQEVSVKKIILLGPHASGGLYHGPFWVYLNYPAYFLGHGNPLAVGWNWITLIMLFLLGSFLLVKALLGKTAAYLYVLFESGYLAFHGRQMNNPHGAMLLIPAFYFFFVRYWDTGKLRYLLLHLLLGAGIVQFQIAIGIPFLVLSFTAIAFKCWQNKKFIPLLTYFLLVIPLANFIIFDVRHDHILLQLVTSFVSPERGGHTFNYLLFINDRVKLAFGAMEILRRDPGYRNMGLFLVMLLFIAKQIKDGKYKTFYVAFLYFYFGFFALSFVDKGPILYFYLYPLFPLVHLIFVSLYTSRYRGLFLIVFSTILVLNLSALVGDARDANTFIGKDVTSWKFLSSVASTVYSGPEKEFGYFVFTPDTVGYGPKYAMQYTKNLYNKSAYPFQKKPVAYLIAEPHPYFKSDWWKENKAHISSQPILTIPFPNGYKIEKYELTEDEVKVPAESDIDPGLFFR